MTKRQKLVRGVGVNDADYPVTIHATICGRQKMIWRCKFYTAWSNMLERCYSEKHVRRNKTYAGCSVAPEWHTFSAFRDWMVTQPWEGNQLDKDILFPGNKVYGPSTCVFVPQAINGFLIDQVASRGEWPAGVHWSSQKKKFKAQCGNPLTGKTEHVGLFDCRDAAHEAWRTRKHQHACTYADQQTDQRVAKALRGRYAKGAAL